MRTRLGILTLVTIASVGLLGIGIDMGKAASPGSSAGSAPAHAMVSPAELKWTPLFLGLETAVVHGDPAKAGEPFVMRVRATRAAEVAAHWHPQDEHVTVLEGSIKLGMGEKYDAKGLQDIAAGSYVFIPRTMRHYVWHGPDSVIQVHGIGPFQLYFVNPADDPRTAAPGK
ncbi:MAG TPA: cupin domain-containing protein [Terriglobales bacterium]|nr:cupin domain-containing protein [Terriglobales bacterium]